MPLDDYGLWCAHAVSVTAEDNADDPVSPHIHLIYDDGNRDNLSAAINVKSKAAISELALYKIENFSHPILDELNGFGPGFHVLDRQPGGAALDYIRGNLLNLGDGILLPHDIPGMENDLLDLVMPVLERAVAKRSKIYLFGEPFSGGGGIHNVHMNQGSAGQFAGSNGVWQDGGLIIQDADLNRHVAIYLAFGSQAVHTGEDSGHALPGSQLVAELLGATRPDIPDDQPPRPDDGGIIADDLRIAIVAALVNPAGNENQPNHTGRPELIYLMNRTAQGLSLNGWKLLNRTDAAHTLSGDVWLAPGEVRAVTMGAVPLSNRGGLISLLDVGGMKVDGVSYTREQARIPGNLILFR